MGQKYIVVDVDNVVLELIDEDQETPSGNAIPIPDDEYSKIVRKYGDWKWEGDAIIPNNDAIIAGKREQLIEMARVAALETMISGQRVSIEAMNETALDAAIEAGGV